MEQQEEHSPEQQGYSKDMRRRSEQEEDEEKERGVEVQAVRSLAERRYHAVQEERQRVLAQVPRRCSRSTRTRTRTGSYSSTKW